MTSRVNQINRNWTLTTLWNPTMRTQRTHYTIHNFWNPILDWILTLPSIFKHWRRESWRRLPIEVKLNQTPNDDDPNDDEVVYQISPSYRSNQRKRGVWKYILWKITWGGFLWIERGGSYWGSHERVDEKLELTLG